MADENLTAFRETTPNHEFYGAEKVENEAFKREERRKKKEAR